MATKIKVTHTQSTHSKSKHRAPAGRTPPMAMHNAFGCRMQEEQAALRASLLGAATRDMWRLFKVGLYAALFLLLGALLPPNSPMLSSGPRSITVRLPIGELEDCALASCVDLSAVVPPSLFSLFPGIASAKYGARDRKTALPESVKYTLTSGSVVAGQARAPGPTPPPCPAAGPPPPALQCRSGRPVPDRSKATLYSLGQHHAARIAGVLRSPLAGFSLPTRPHTPSRTAPPPRRTPTLARVPA